MLFLFEPQGWDFGLKTGIEEGGTEEEEEEKIPMCECIGHQPLQGRCPVPPQLQPQLT